MTPPEVDLGAVRVPYAGGPGTRLYLLLGDPVAHSRSPAMQRAALREAGLDADYVACAVPPSQLDGCLARLRDLAARGVLGGANVTVPHKQAVLAAMDDLDATAALAGAVNTIVVERPRAGIARWIGHDTDVAGLVLALAELGATLAGARVVVLGTGGMARAAVAAAVLEGAGAVHVAGRDPARARAALEGVAARWRGRLPARAASSFQDAAGAIARADVLVQATTLGMQDTDPLPISLGGTSPHLCVLDAVYGAQPTPLVGAARAAGLRAADGRGLLLHQGARSFALWTGAAPALEAMRRALGS